MRRQERKGEEIPLLEPMMEPVYLMSIRPQYARAIFAGVKRYELRKLSGTKPIEEGAIIVVYSSGKVRSIVGEFRVGRVIVATPERVWATVRKPGTGIGDDAWAYLRGGKRAMALEVVNPLLYPRPVTLDEIRRIIPGWMPPFSYRRLLPGDRIYELIVRKLRASLYGE
ncbi:MAG: DNA-binding protein [Desulfurococcales archaeon]|nr:DNA-binding protein [Desulfurococcales archaeon]